MTGFVVRARGAFAHRATRHSEVVTLAVLLLAARALAFAAASMLG